MQSPAPLRFAARASRIRASLAAASLVSTLALVGAASAHRRLASSPKQNSAPHLSADLTGSVPTRPGERIRLSTELGSIVVHTQDADKVDYKIHLETDASQKDAQKLLKSFAISEHDTPDGLFLKAASDARRSSGRLWVTLELDIPKNSALDASTGGGNIDASEIDGRVSLETAGGNITAGNIGGPAHLETGGGNIGAKEVAGDLVADTGGGHITIDTVAGNATLHTSGGHIRVNSIQGTAHLDTGGGNITLEHSGGELTAETGGGEIEVGEAAGLVRARTGGGGIRVVRVIGPTNLETSGGSIYLTQVDSPVKASTSAGGITAWFVSPPKSSGTCDLQSSAGDIVVHMPRNLAVTIDAEVALGNEHRVIVDPAFPLRISYDDSSNGARTVRAEGSLNGGGPLVRLRTVDGNIRFELSDVSKQLEIYKQQMEQLQQQLQAQLQKAGVWQQPAGNTGP